MSEAESADLASHDDGDDLSEDVADVEGPSPATTEEGNDSVGIDESLDVLQAMQELSDEVADLLDGQTGVRQFGVAAATLLDDGYAAVKGADEIPEELGDLTEKEVKTLAAEAIKIVRKFDA